MTAPNEPELKLAGDFPAASAELWRSMVDKALKGVDFDKRLVSRTADGIAIQPLYTRAMTEAGTAAGDAGSAPFTRATKHRLASRGAWDIRSLHADSDPDAVNAAILDDLNGGVTSIAIQIGGPGLPVGKDALAAALKDVMLDVCPIALIAGEKTFESAMAMMAIWQERGIADNEQQGAFGFDPLGQLAATGQLAEPLETALARAVALAHLTLDRPQVRALTADGVPFHNAGASDAQELGLMLSAFVAYLRAAEAGGIASIDSIPKIAVSLAADCDQFATMAKLRAARKLIWRIGEASGAGDAAGLVHYTTPTSYRMMSRRDPWTNILRTTLACAGAALGGADSILVLPFTFALGRPDPFSRRVARNIQIVCQEESNLGRVTDPAGGSWYIEALTSELAKASWAVFQDIEARGGLAAALTSGYVQDLVGRMATVRAKAVASGKMELTGVSAFPLLGKDGVKVAKWPKPPLPDPDALPALQVKPMRARRLAEPFEALRAAADKVAATGKPFRVFLANLGPIAEHNVRATWIKNYLAAGGIETISNDGFATADDATTAFKASGTAAVCICSSDGVNAELGAPAATSLKTAGAKLVLMAGRPGDKEASLKAAGVDQFLCAGGNAVAILKDLHEKLASPIA